MTFAEKLEGLVEGVQELSLATSLEAIIDTVKSCARRLAGADGATFILRDGDMCHYVDEDAIGPLWKGRRFPMEMCISGWTMHHRTPAVIEDIYADERIPADAYRPTFVKSLVIVPIRTIDPIGAIGAYWAARHRPSTREVKLLQALANTTSVAMANVRGLRGFIQMCAHCRRVSDESGRWFQLEEYVLKRTDASFSHGICPTCRVEHYPEV
jgi:GAF domain-containing protein